MGNENFVALHASGDSAGEKEDDGDSIDNGGIGVDSQHATSKEKEDKVSSVEVGHETDVRHKELHGLPVANLENNLIDGDSDMEIEDLNAVPAVTDSNCGLGNNGIYDLNCEPSQADCLYGMTADKDTKITSEYLVKTKDNARREDGPCMAKPVLDKNSVDSWPILQVNANVTETVAVTAAFNHTAGGEMGCIAVQDEISIGKKKMNSTSISGVKRPRMMFDEQNPSVCVKYNSLTRSSKHKLEELLQQWSEWHAQHASSAEDPDEALESGEETFFPALHIGLEKASSVSFWMDQQTRKQQNNEFIPLDYKSVPMYDRGYALGLMSDEGTSNVEGGLEIVDDAARCFNCGSYNHALKECPKPRDNVAVNNARKQLKSKRNQIAGSRNQTRYYQNSPAGKYDGLRPGALDAETRKLLGLGELDPPPWLNRMREIGYPPGYLDPDEEDQPSGITIFADGEIKEEQEDGEIVEALPIETGKREPKRKMSVEFPGLNGPIPKNADERLWAAAAPSYSDISRNQSHRRSSTNNSLELISRVHHREERWSRLEFRDDGPPGVDKEFDPAMSTYLPRYTSTYETSYSSYSPRLNSHGRFESDRSRRSRFLDEGSFSSSPYSSRHSPTDYGSSRHRNWAEESRNGYDFEYSTHSSRDRQDRYRHLSRR